MDFAPFINGTTLSLDRKSWDDGKGFSCEKLFSKIEVVQRGVEWGGGFVCCAAQCGDASVLCDVALWWIECIVFFGLGTQDHKPRLV